MGSRSRARSARQAFRPSGAGPFSTRPALLVLLLLSAAPPARAGDFRAMTWNLGRAYMGGRVDSWPDDERLPEIAKTIREAAPDALCVQEIKDEAQLARLAKRLGPAYAHFAMSEDDADRHSALFTREASTTTRVEAAGSRYAAAVLRGGALEVACLHFSYYMEDRRREQVRAAAAWGRGREGAAIAMGDLNFEPGDPEHRTLKAVFTDATEGLGATTVYWIKLDYVLAKLGGGSVRSAKILTGKRWALMDHLPVVVEFVLP